MSVAAESRVAVALRAALVAAVTLAGAAWLHAKGPVKVLVGSVEIDEFATTWYMLCAFPILGMLVADVVAQARDRGLFARGTLVLAGFVALVVVVANLRLGVHLPISGHVLLLGFFLVLRLSRRPWPAFAVIEFSVAVALFVAVSAIKLFRWHDLLTWSVGLAGGAALALICRRAARAPGSAATS